VTAARAFRSITARAAHSAVGEAIARAEAEGAAVVACVVDAAGVPVAGLRMAGAPLHSNGIAADKAYTAASFRLPTEELARCLEDNPVLQHGIARRPRTILFAGGLPILEQGDLIGGIGVSGASEEQDRRFAEAGLEAVAAFAAAEK